MSLCCCYGCFSLKYLCSQTFNTLSTVCNCNGVTETYVSISHAAQHSHGFGFPFCEKGCGLRTAALQQILVKMRVETLFIRHLGNEMSVPSGLVSGGVLPWCTVEKAHQKESCALQRMAGYCSPLWRGSALEPALCPAWRKQHSVHFPFKFTRKMNY